MAAPAPLRVAAFPARRNRARQPYNALLAESLAAQGSEVEELTAGSILRRRFDVLHVHWPERVLDPPGSLLAAVLTAGLLAVLAIGRLRGARLVWTVHNLESHDRRHPWLEKLLWRGFLAQLDGVISMSAGGLELARARHPALAELPAVVIPHGSFRPAYPPALARAAARRQLGFGEGDRVVLFLGQIRAYKGVPSLLHAFREVADPRARLIVAGSPGSPELRRQIEAAAAADPRVTLRLGFVPDAELPLLFGAADLVTLPYLEILNSGAAILALDFGRPILVPRRGAMAELQAKAGREWVHTFEGPLDGSALAAALVWAAELRPAPPEAVPPWSEIATATLAFYRSLVAAR
ncbi:MAG TPA: glycosyltransferase [Thermoanaerobaculia bacterium]|nr:glycosyltransferase [Thermoanaerobaculia bacterium]